MRDAPRKPTCIGCPHDLHYSDPVPMRTMGVMMHMGERFCTGSKRARRFKRGDPKLYVPDWCPKRKNPCELRIYGFKSVRDWLLHVSLYQDQSGKIFPDERRYAVEYELTTELTPMEFWKRCRTEPCGSLLHVAVHQHHIVEIDDGLKPVFFYKMKHGYQMLSMFKGEIARQNKRTYDQGTESDLQEDRKGAEN